MKTLNNGIEKNILFSQLSLAIIPLGICINIVIGTLANMLKVPIYLDAIGTIMVTLLIGTRAGVLVGVGSFLLAGILVNPVLPWFSGTQAAIAVYVGWVAGRGFFKNNIRTIIAGIGLGILAGIVSAPVIIYLFGGITGSGSSFLTAYLLASGNKMINSVFLSGMASEPIDKTFQCLIAIWMIRSIPISVLSRFNNEKLNRNDFLKS